MNYAIQIVGDDELPQGMNKVVVERPDGTALMLINGDPARVWRWMMAWEDTLEPRAAPAVLLPTMPLLYAS